MSARRVPLNPSFFKLQVRWLHLHIPVTYFGKCLGMRSLAAVLQRELFRVYTVEGGIPLRLAFASSCAAQRT